MPTEPEPTPEPTPDPEPTPQPPGPDEPECVSLLEGLPVIGPATVPLTSFLADVLSVTPGALGLEALAGSPDDSGSTDCVLGAVVGPACCAAAETDRRGSTR